MIWAENPRHLTVSQPGKPGPPPGTLSDTGGTPRQKHHNTPHSIHCTKKNRSRPSGKTPSKHDPGQHMRCKIPLHGQNHPKIAHPHVLEMPRLCPCSIHCTKKKRRGHQADKHHQNVTLGSIRGTNPPSQTKSPQITCPYAPVMPHMQLHSIHCTEKI